MITDLTLVGIGTGSERHITLEGVSAIREAHCILLPLKDGKDELAALRQRILDAAGYEGEIATFDYPVRDPSLPYLDRVHAWHDEIARCWTHAASGKVTLLVWGDPSLYDSTIRIAERLSPPPRIRVVPGITAIQALTASFGMPLNTVAGEVVITTGRRLRDHGWPKDAETVVVMLDGETSFAGLSGVHIWWGAYLGSPNEILISGALDDVAEQIVTARAQARAHHGWIMDTYLLRRI